MFRLQRKQQIRKCSLLIWATAGSCELSCFLWLLTNRAYTHQWTGNGLSRHYPNQCWTLFMGRRRTGFSEGYWFTSSHWEGTFWATHMLERKQVAFYIQMPSKIRNFINIFIQAVLALRYKWDLGCDVRCIIQRIFCTIWYQNMHTTPCRFLWQKFANTIINSTWCCTFHTEYKSPNYTRPLIWLWDH